jgi:hypothetical protein
MAAKAKSAANGKSRPVTLKRLAPTVVDEHQRAETHHLKQRRIQWQRSADASLGRPNTFAH